MLTRAEPVTPCENKTDGGEMSWYNEKKKRKLTGLLRDTRLLKAMMPQVRFSTELVNL